MLLDRPDHRPREDEPQQQCEGDRSRRHSYELIARVFVGARVLGDDGVRPRRHGVRELRRVLVEVDAEQLGPRAKGRHSFRRPAAGLDDLLVHARELPAGCADPAQKRLVLGWRSESEIVGIGRRGNLCDGARDRLVDGQGACAELMLVQVGEVLVEVPCDVLGLQNTNVTRRRCEACRMRRLGPGASRASPLACWTLRGVAARAPPARRRAGPCQRTRRAT